MTSRSQMISGTKTLAMRTCLFGLAMISISSAGPVFQGIGDLPGGITATLARAVSADGLVVVGISSGLSGAEAFRWTAGGGMVGLGDLPGGSFQSDASAVSADGSVIVGKSNSAQAPVVEAFRWAGGVMEGLGDFPGGSFGSLANAVSADGTVVAGSGNHATGNEAFAWRRETGLVALGDLPGGLIASNAFGMSASGEVIVGGSISENGSEAFRWTAETGMQGLGFLDGGGALSTAEAVSRDGTAIVGYSDSLVDVAGYMWTEVDGMINLGAGFRPSALSDDASIVVGSAFLQEALIWTQDSGLQNLHELLESDFSLDLTGWTLEAATGISADGMTIVGYGTNPLGDTEGWIFVVPEPSTLALLAAGMFMLRRPSKRKSPPRARPPILSRTH